MNKSHALLALLTAGLLACSAEERSEPTYYRDVKPLLDRSCVSCHQPGQIGVGTMDDYATAHAMAGIIDNQVASRTMPPWLAADGCRDYQYDPSLSADERTLINDWVTQGAVAGSPQDAPQTAPPATLGLPRVDLTMELPVDYSPDKTKADDYRCFLVDWPEDEVRYVTGFNVKPDNASTVHHVIAYIAPPNKVAEYEALDAADEEPGYVCYGGPGGVNDGGTGFFGAWAPGTMVGEYAEGSGIRMDPGSKVILQMHYNTLTWDGAPDRTAIEVMLTDSVEKEGKFYFYTDFSWVLNDTMEIPAGNPDVVHTTSSDPGPWMAGGKPFTAHLASLHMHTRGTQARLSRIPAGTEQEECLLDIPRWDFNWQFGYLFTEPVKFSPGDHLKLTCHWDNSPQNQPSVEGMPMAPENLSWGDGTNDEMCLGLLYVTVD